jgi:predicted HicB family RNase H-like nuclease
MAYPLSNYMNRRIRRVVDGATFDSKSMDCVARYTGRWEDDDDVTWKRAGFIVRNASGVLYNVVIDVRADATDDEDVGVSQVSTEQAVRICEQEGADIIEDFFELPPEAKPAEKVESFLVRMPKSLKETLSEHANRERMSMNEAVVQCLQRCFADGAKQ